MKKYVLFLITLFTFSSLFSQKLKYRDIIGILQSGDEILAYNLLLDYQKQDPYFANTYFQLGNLSYKWMLEADPFLDINRVDYFIYNTKLYYGLALKHIKDDKSEVRKNKKYYMTIPEFAQKDKLSQEDVIAFLNERIKETNQYDRHVHEIYSYFYRMVNNYNKTVAFYRNILSSYKQIKDLYLSPSEEVRPMLDTLRILFDSTMFLYQQYKAAITSYPIKKYNQSLLLSPIETYRLEGITSSNFLADTIKVWDYGTWVKNVRLILNNDIRKLRSQISITNKMMNKYERDILKSDYSNDLEFFNLQPKLIYEIEKYDYKSLLSAYFMYRKDFLDFLTFSKFKYNDTTDTKTKFIIRARNYRYLTLNKNSVDSLWQIVQKRISPAEMHKFKDFFVSEFPGGFSNYIKEKKEFANKYLARQYERYKYFIFRDLLNYPFEKDTVVYKNMYIPVYVNYIEPQLAEDGQIVVLDKVTGPKGDIYLGGYMRHRNYSNAFIAKVVDGMVQWVKVNPAGLNTYSSVVKLSVSPEGVAAVVHTEGPSETTNVILQLDYVGDQQFVIKLNNSSMPKFISYDDINSVFVVAYKGRDLQPLTVSDDSLVIERWDVNSREMQWSRSFDIKGSLINIVKMDTVYHVFANSKSYTDLNKVKNTASLNNIIQIKIGFSGQVMDISKALKEQFFGIAAVKLSSRYINITGLEGDPQPVFSKEFASLPKLKYFLLEKN